MHALCLRMLPLVYPELPLARITAVQTASQASADRVRRELGPDVLATTSLDQLLSHPGMQVIDCCAPTGDHARIAQAVITAGKAFFCEKPLAATLAESEQIVALAAEHRIVQGERSSGLGAVPGILARGSDRCRRG